MTNKSKATIARVEAEKAKLKSQQTTAEANTAAIDAIAAKEKAAQLEAEYPALKSAIDNKIKIAIQELEDLNKGLEDAIQKANAVKQAHDNFNQTPYKPFSCSENPSTEDFNKAVKDSFKQYTDRSSLSLEYTKKQNAADIAVSKVQSLIIVKKSHLTNTLYTESKLLDEKLRLALYDANWKKDNATKWAGFAMRDKQLEKQREEEARLYEKEEQEAAAKAELVYQENLNKLNAHQATLKSQDNPTSKNQFQDNDKALQLIEADKASQNVLVSDLAIKLESLLKKSHANTSSTSKQAPSKSKASAPASANKLSNVNATIKPSSKPAKALTQPVKQNDNLTTGLPTDTNNSIPSISEAEKARIFKPAAPLVNENDNTDTNPTPTPSNPKAISVIPNSLKDKLFLDFEVLLKKSENLSKRGFNKESALALNLANLLKNKSENFFNSGIEVQKEQFKTFYQECKKELTEADTNWAKNHRGYGQVIADILQSLTLVGLLIGVIQYSRTGKYSLFPVKTKSTQAIESAQQDFDKVEKSFKI